MPSGECGNCGYSGSTFRVELPDYYIFGRWDLADLFVCVDNRGCPTPCLGNAQAQEHCRDSDIFFAQRNYHIHYGSVFVTRQTPDDYKQNIARIRSRPQKQRHYHWRSVQWAARRTILHDDLDTIKDSVEDRESQCTHGLVHPGVKGGSRCTNSRVNIPWENIFARWMWQQQTSWEVVSIERKKAPCWWGGFWHENHKRYEHSYEQCITGVNYVYARKGHVEVSIRQYLYGLLWRRSLVA